LARAAIQVPVADPDAPNKILFIIFVDAIFTTLFERLFTNVSDVTGAN
jgi:hypothetical protein